MPELPDLEVLKENILRQFGERRVIDVYARRGAGQLAPKIVGQKLVGLTRRGKFLIFAFGKSEISVGAELVVHLMLNGRLTVAETSAERAGIVLLALVFENHQELRLSDYTFWAKFWLGSNGHLDKLGVEPTSSDFTLDFFRTHLQKSRCQVKPLLMKQEFIAGLGNAYTDEALFAAKISPNRLAKSLSAEEIKLLYNSIKKVIPWGITQIKKVVGYRVAEDEKRAFMKVYRKGGGKCPRCGGKIQEVKLGGRDTFFCEECQR
jgi:formamidopyrimidine-DNA glycosylase